jgi:hypothetical protein
MASNVSAHLRSSERLSTAASSLLLATEEMAPGPVTEALTAHEEAAGVPHTQPGTTRVPCHHASYIIDASCIIHRCSPRASYAGIRRAGAE